MPGLFKTSNPALNAKTFENRSCYRQRSDDAAGHGQQDRLPAVLRCRNRRLDVVASSHAARSRGAVPVGRTCRRARVRPRHDIQEGMGAGHRSDLRALRRSRAGRNFSVSQPGLFRYRAPSARTDGCRHRGDAAVVYVWRDSSDSEIHRWRHRRYRRDLSLVYDRPRDGLLRPSRSLCSTATDRGESRSACLS